MKQFFVTSPREWEMISKATFSPLYLANRKATLGGVFAQPLGIYKLKITIESAPNRRAFAPLSAPIVKCFPNNAPILGGYVPIHPNLTISQATVFLFQKLIRGAKLFCFDHCSPP